MAVTSNTIQFGASFTAVDQVRQLEDRGLHRRRRADPPAVRVRRGDQGRRAREVPRAQPDRRQLQGRPRGADAARPSRRGVHLAAPVRRLLERQLRARWRRHLRPGDREPRARPRRRDDARVEPHRERGRRQARAAAARRGAAAAAGAEPARRRDLEPEPDAARARDRHVRGRQARQGAACRGARVRSDRRVPRLVQPRDVRRARGVGGAGAAGVRAPAGGRDREAAGGPAGDPDDGARELRGDQVAVPHSAHRRRTR